MMSVLFGGIGAVAGLCGLVYFVSAYWTVKDSPDGFEDANAQGDLWRGGFLCLLAGSCLTLAAALV